MVYTKLGDVCVMCIVDTANTNTVPRKQPLVTRIEIRIMRLEIRKDKGIRIKGALQATQDPMVPK